MIFLRNNTFLWLKSRFVTMSMRSSLFFSLRAWESQAPIWLLFIIFIQVTADWDELGSSAESQVICIWFYLTHILKASWSISDDRSGQGSCVNLAVSIGTLTVNTINCLRFFCIFIIIIIIILKFSHGTCQWCTFHFSTFTGVIS